MGREGQRSVSSESGTKWALPSLILIALCRVLFSQLRWPAEGQGGEAAF